MGYTIVIPSRMHSTRLPGKPLLPIAGKPMIVRVAERAAMTAAGRIIVATDHEDILSACRAAGVEAVMTREDHATGTDRIVEVVKKLSLPADEVVVNIQGDEPLIPPEIVDRVAALLAGNTARAMATAAHPIDSLEEFLSPNVVKVEMNRFGEAVTFSRAPVPWPRDEFMKGPKEIPGGLKPLRHIGLYAYTAGFLLKYPDLDPSPLERAEKLEQLRALWNGFRIAVEVLDKPLPPGVDTAEDLERVRRVYGDPS